MSDTQSPEKETEAPKNQTKQEPIKPDADAADSTWSEEMMEWAIASSTCGGLPHKKDETADGEADAKNDTPSCP